MITRWYYGKNTKTKFLSLAEIAETCGCTLREVKQWFGRKALSDETAAGVVVNVGEVIKFLLKNSMPISSSLLPARSKKILYITPEDESEGNCGRIVMNIYDLLSTNFNLLIDSSPLGKIAELTLYTFSPDIILIYAQSLCPELKKLFDLTKGFPEIQTILISETISLKEIERAGIHPCPLILNSAFPFHILEEQLHTYLRMQQTPWKERRTITER